METKDFTKILRWMVCNFNPDFVYECFDTSLANHIANKYYDLIQYKSQTSAVIELFLNLDKNCQEAILNRIIKKIS